MGKNNKNNNKKPYYKKDDSKSTDKKQLRDYKDDQEYKKSGEYPSHSDKKESIQSGNDPAWYNKDPQLVKDVATIPFAQVTGLTQEWYTSRPETPNDGNSGWYRDGHILPGAMRIDYVPCYGISVTGASAINVAAQKNYTFIRHANSGSRNYEAPDLAMYFYALDSAISLWAFYVRIYGMLRMYFNNNRFAPRYFLQTMGLSRNNIKEFERRMPEMRAVINMFASKLASFNIPANLDVIRRHMFMNSNLYFDHSTTKGQIYYFMPEGYYIWNGTKYETGTCCEYHKLTSDKFDTIEHMQDTLDSVLNDMMRNEDIGLISGDIERAYGGNVFKFAPIDEEYIIQPVHDTDILEQIHNSTFVGELNTVWEGSSTDDGFTRADIYQKNGLIMYNPSFYSDFDSPYTVENYETWKALIDADSNSDPLHVMYVSRLIPMVDLNSTQTFQTGENKQAYRYNLMSCGSEIPTKFTIFASKQDGAPGLPVTSGTIASSDTYSVDSALNICVNLGEFNWHPRVYFYTWTISNYLYPNGVLWETKNVASIADYNIKLMHDAAIMSLLNI